MNENLNQEKSSAQALPESKIIIRAMESDIKEIERGGGEITTSQFTDIEESKIEDDFSANRANQEKAVFDSSAIISVENSLIQKLTKWKIAGIIISVLAIIIIFGLIGYFVISPWLFPKEMPVVQ